MRTFSARVWNYPSDNPKSKTCPELCRRIENPKWLGILAIAFTFAFGGTVAQAQRSTKVPRIGYVSGTGDPKTPGPQVEGFRQGLRDVGYIEEKNILVEYRYFEEKSDITSLVAELVQLKVDVLVVGPLPAIRAAKQATKTIPIIMVTTQDPVAAGLIENLARPGGNITGVTTLSARTKREAAGIAEGGGSGVVARWSPCECGAVVDW